MKTIIINFKIFCLLLINHLIYSQDYVKNDSLKVKGITYTFSHISFGNSNLTKYYKVLTCNTNDYNKVKNEIINCANKTKLEFSEFYLLSVPVCNTNDEETLTEFMYKIDTTRIILNLSTSLINFKYNNQTNKFEYLINEELKNIKYLKNYKLRIRPKEVCDFLKL